MSPNANKFLPYLSMRRSQNQLELQQLLNEELNMRLHPVTAFMPSSLPRDIYQQHVNIHQGLATDVVESLMRRQDPFERQRGLAYPFSSSLRLPHGTGTISSLGSDNLYQLPSLGYNQSNPLPPTAVRMTDRPSLYQGSYSFLPPTATLDGGGRLKRQLPAFDSDKKQAATFAPPFLSLPPRLRSQRSEANFPTKLMEAMILYEARHKTSCNKPVFAWLRGGTSFIVFHQEAFCRQFLQEYGLSDEYLKYDSFVRKLNRWLRSTDVRGGTVFSSQALSQGTTFSVSKNEKQAAS